MKNIAKHISPVKMSAVMPNYNGAHFLPNAIQSLLNQTEPFDEIIIVDDGSTDNSVTIIESFMKENPHIRLVRHEKNQGVNAATNTGMQHSNGDYILFCATDDRFGSKIVELAKDAARRFPGVGVICGDGVIERFDLNKPFYRMLPFPANSYLSPAEFKTFTRKTYVGFNSAGGMFMHRQAILDAGLVHPITRWHGDWLLYFVVAFRKGIYYFNEIFIYVNMRQASYSEGKNNKKIQDQVMLDTLHIIAKEYPELWDDFKQAALIPHHAIRYIPLFFSDRIARQFMTTRLIWKCVINNRFIVRVGRLFPYRIILTVRKLLRA